MPNTSAPLILVLSLFLTAPAYAVDADIDGMEDSWELANGLDPANSADASQDPDADQLNNLAEHNNLTNPFNRDTDGDWLKDGSEVLTFGTDPTDRDTDGDGATDFEELINGFDPLDPNDTGVDSDNDGLTDFAEVSYYKTNPNNGDTDGDWLPDGQEVNTYGSDPTKADSDGDGFTDFEEMFFDDDNDGLINWQELSNGTNPANPDTDGDLMPDGWEVEYSTDPLSPSDKNLDPDNDGYTSYQEFRLDSEPNNATSVPETLAGDYAESFEDTLLPELWYTPTPGAAAQWTPSCKAKAADGACSLKAGSGDTATVNFMARFTSGSLRISWAAWTQHNFTISLDGIEVFAFSGGSPWWTSVDIPVSGGAHELSFEYDATDAPFGITAIDAVSFTPSGIASRPDNNTCLAPPLANADSEVVKFEVFPEIDYFRLATKLLQPPGDSSRWFVLEQEGRIKVFDVADPANIRTYLDISSNVIAEQESGLLGLAFDPNFPTVPEIYVVYSSAANHTTLSRFILDDTDAPVSPVEQVILTLEKTRKVHYGGDINFGPDGMLYAGFGEDNYPNRSQDTTNLFGTMIRIDVRGVAWPAPAYNIPAGNAFPASNPKCGPTAVNSSDCPEIFAWGFRNPWRWSFDSLTGDIWLGDVGKADVEEVNIVELGGNYGWACHEGDIDGPRPQDCTPDMIPPVATYTHDEGRAVIGGTVYRGTAIPEMYGRYVFADLGPGPIWELLPDGNGGYTKNQIENSPGNVTSLTAGNDNELYFIMSFSPDWNPGGRVPPAIDMLVPAEGEDDGDDDLAPVIQENLADTGCVDPDDPTQVAAGLIPFNVNARLWSDGAAKNRYMGLPNGTTIDIDGNDDWIFPVGTVLVKDFHLDGKIIETRLLMNRLDTISAGGKWEGFSYEWNDDETSATLVVGGKTKDINGQLWTYPSSNQCDQCHTEAAGKTLGPETAQLNGDFHYPQGAAAVNQLTQLNDIGMFTTPLSTPVNQLPRMADPEVVTETLDDRARAYLATNCSHCHRPGTGVPSDMDLRHTTLLNNMNACDTPPALGDLGIGASARLIAPGDAASSVIYHRMSTRNAHGMPPVGTNSVDTEGTLLIASWIDSLQSCQ